MAIQSYDDFQFPQFNIPGFPYDDLVQQMLASMNPQTGGSYARLGAGGSGSGGGLLNPVPNQPPFNPGQPNFTPGLPNVPPAGASPGSPILPNNGIPPAGYGDATTQTKAAVRGSPDYTQGWSPEAIANAQKMYMFGMPSGPNGWANTNGPIQASSLSPDDMNFLRQWERVGGGSAEGAIHSLLSGTQQQMFDVNAGDAAHGMPSSYDASSYSGPMRQYFQQWLAQNPNSGYDLGGYHIPFNPTTMQYDYSGFGKQPPATNTINNVIDDFLKQASNDPHQMDVLRRLGAV